MKKHILAIVISVIVVVMIFTAAVSCGGVKYEDDVIDFDADALAVNVVSYYVAQGDETVTEFEIQVGLSYDFDDTGSGGGGGSTVPVNARAAMTIGELGETIGKACGLSLESLGSYVVTQTFGSEKVIYCFKVVGSFANTLDGPTNHFGFFYIKRDYKIENPSWTVGLGDKIFDALSGKISLDKQKTQYRFFLALNSTFKTNDGEWVYKNVLDKGDDIYNCLMFAGEDYGEVTFTARSMASGWYIIAILIGVAVVLIFYFVAKERDDKDEYRQPPAPSEHSGNAFDENDENIIIEQDPFKEENNGDDK